MKSLLTVKNGIIAAALVGLAGIVRSEEHV